MPSIYDNTPNIFRSDFKELSLTDSGTFSLPEDGAKKVTIFNDAGYKVRVYKTNDYAATTSGTSNATGIYIGIEDGISFTVPGVADAKNISIQKDVSANPTFSLKYILER